MNITDYEETWYLVSYFFIFKNEEGIQEEEWLKKINTFTREEIRNRTQIAHEKLINDKTGQYRKDI